ncbi:uncharacterized protein MONOS_14491 [Monocercomonoides exilis]|uniref:uncharacterized protein n=1 Tax=Monocercomonoides exilis TaxID=2049356 RepID=UPI003559FF4C|nr:hypothetical protein MONOS_14491 [Monocercomonoides exilis]|eukprot:MONOS_14491.1-p1 / transcript=MONOS_14491.1 / gene=MONOS_14491 / organism=Monocercomonoides_exilis_PA203 / gene_product=unspecified product / transcript_product=unspecified product / location=Mono_scaffold01012:4251-4781(-) / protein_length=140 / sequence_SO=supercontig / SO=protein_coding / is_pseudo=false
MRSETSKFKDNFVQTQVQTKTSGGKTVKIIIKKHPNPRIDAVEALQRWMELTKTTFKDEHVRHAVITHLARREGADWKAINAYERWEQGSRVDQEYYSVLLVQDTNWILGTIGSPVPRAEKGDKSEKDSEREDIINENT